MAKKQIKLSKRSINRVATELSLIFDRYGNEQVYANLKDISDCFGHIASYCCKIQPKINEIIKDSRFQSALITTIKNRLADINYHKENIDCIVTKIKPVQTNDVENLKAALIYLLDNYDYVAYQNKKLTVRTEDIFVTHGSKTVGFGAFDIIFNFSDLNNYGEDSVYSLFVCKPLTPQRRDGYPHPNINSSNRLCLGDGEAALYKCLIDARIGDFVDIVQQILRTDSNNPLHSIGNW